MNEPILNSGFPQVAPEPKPFSLYDQTPNAQANPSRDNAQPFNLTPFTFAVAEKVATAANERMLSYDVMGQALKGKTPMEYFDELGAKAEDVGTTNDKYNTEIERLNDEIRRLKPQQADDTGYRAAMDAFNNLATQAPMAPTLERLNVSDTDKIMLGFALLTGANPNDAIGNFIKVKQGFVDQNNEQAMGQYKLDTTNFGNQMDAAGTRLTNERQSLNDTQQSLNNQYNTRLDAMNSAANRLALNGRTEEANIQDGMYKASMAVNRKYIAQGIYTQKDYDEDSAKAIKNGFDPERMIWPPINVPTVSASNIAADNTRQDNKDAQLKTTQTWKNAKALFDMRMKTVNMSGQVTEADRQALLPIARQLLPESPESLLPMIGEDWRKLQGQQRITETNRTNLVKEGQGQARVNIAGAKENRIGAGGGSGGGSGGGGAPKEAKTDKQYRVDYENVNRDIKELQAVMDKTTDVDKLKDQSAKMSGLIAKMKDVENYIEWTDEELKTKFGIFNENINSMLGAFGMSPVNPKGDAGGLSGSLATPPTPNPPTPTKPPGTSPNAGKGQSGDTKKKANGITFNPNPR